MRFRIHRSDGKTGNYSQPVAGRAAVLAKRFNPAHMFTSGPVVIGVQNPFNVLNPDQVCWVEVETNLRLPRQRVPGVDQCVRLAGREEYESLLAEQWPKWRKFKQSAQGDLLEALIELSLTSGTSVFLHVLGKVRKTDLIEEIFGRPAITATFAPNGTIYVNPRAIIRARVYHSQDQVEYPPGLWVAEADDI